MALSHAKVGNCLPPLCLIPLFSWLQFLPCICRPTEVGGKVSKKKRREQKLLAPEAIAHWFASGPSAALVDRIREAEQRSCLEPQPWDDFGYGVSSLSGSQTRGSASTSNRSTPPAGNNPSLWRPKTSSAVARRFIIHALGGLTQIKKNQREDAARARSMRP